MRLSTGILRACSLAVGFLAFAGAAHATETDATEVAEDIASAVDAEPREYQVTLPRFVAIGTPGFALDGFLDDHTTHWTDGMANFAWGTEFILRKPGEFDLVFGLEWADIRTPQGFWLDSGDPIRDADWTHSELYLLTPDVAINWLVGLDKNDTAWFYYGIGLGAGIILGEFQKWDVDPSCLGAAGESSDTSLLDEQCIDENGEPRRTGDMELEDRIPPLIPALSITFGTRYVIEDHWVVSLETGFKNIYFYGGLELGYAWGPTL